MRIVDIIDRKRRGEENTDQEELKMNTHMFSDLTDIQMEKDSIAAYEAAYLTTGNLGARRNNVKGDLHLKDSM